MNALFRPPIRTLADLLHRLGDIPADRVRFDPIPGTAKLDDLLRSDNEGCELVDGTLVEKPRGLEESLLAMWLGRLLIEFVQPRNLGIVTGEKGFLELTGGSVRAPDVAFISWDRMPRRRCPSGSDPTSEPGPGSGSAEPKQYAQRKWNASARSTSVAERDWYGRLTPVCGRSGLIHRR